MSKLSIVRRNLKRAGNRSSGSAMGYGPFAEKEESILNEHVARAALRFHVKMYYNRLRHIEISPTNIVTRRFIGFGGTMLAVPNLPPLWEWRYFPRTSPQCSRLRWCFRSYSDGQQEVGRFLPILSIQRLNPFFHPSAYCPATKDVLSFI